MSEATEDTENTQEESEGFFSVTTVSSVAPPFFSMSR
jgi:hypothetical protein